MESGGVDSAVTLIIKAPNQKYEDQTINCFLDWTVERLKTHISKVYPSKPLSKDQRLVYSGKLLQDHLQLGEVLRKQDEFHMLHLVCASHTPPASPMPQTPSSSPAPDSRSPDSRGSTPERPSSNDQPVQSTSPSSPSSSSSGGVPGSYEGLRHRGGPRHMNHPNPPQWPPAAHGIPAANVPPHLLYMPMQMLWWQQMYARQYYLHYQAAMASSQPPAAPPPPQPSPLPVRPAQPNEAVQPPLGPARDPLPENQPANPIQMNAQGGPVLNDDELNRDWLDWLYTVSRAGVLLSIVYFYSSFGRFLMVASAMMLVYLHQAGWFIFRPEQQHRQQPRDGELADAAQEEADRQQDIQEMEQLMDDGMDEDDDSAEEGGGEDQGPAAPEPGVFSTMWAFISTFFTSLIPERPAHLAN